MQDPFGDFGEPPEPELPIPDEQITDEPEPPPEPVTEQPAHDRPEESISGPLVHANDPEASTPVRFPVLVSGAAGVDFSALQEPSRRVAELVEAIQPVLVPPPVVRDLERLVVRAAAITAVTDAASYKDTCEVYELLAANEKGIEGDGSGFDGSIGAVVMFFHRPWKAMCDFRAKYARPVAEHKRRLSDLAGAWKQAELRRAEAQRKADEQRVAEEERHKLEAIAVHAEKVGQPDTAVLAREAKAEVTAPALPLISMVPSAASVPTKGRKKWVAEPFDEDAFYQSLVDDPTRRVAAPMDFGYLDRQATDLKGELGKRFPGVKAVEKGGLTASGKR